MDVSTKQQLVKLRQQLNSGTRKYVCDDKIRQTLKREFHSVDHDIKLKRFAYDEMGFISDCHLLYAVACLGVADIDSIANFNIALRRSNSELHIMDVSDSDTLRGRLKTLMANGFLFKIMYEVDTCDENGNARTTHVSLYTMSKDGVFHMNNMLGKRIVHQDWIQSRSPYELVGVCAAGYAATRVATSSDSFIEFKQGIFQTKAIGTVFIPAILKLKFNGDEPVYIAFIDAFLKRYEIAQTVGDYEDRCIYKVNVIKQYLYFRDSRSSYASVVVVVENNSDLNSMADWMLRCGNFDDNDLERIYFTGEGPLEASKNISDSFLQMKRAKTEQGYEFLPARPVFL